MATNEKTEKVLAYMTRDQRSRVERMAEARRLALSEVLVDAFEALDRLSETSQALLFGELPKQFVDKCADDLAAELKAKKK